ncbi:MAG: metallophosphoesterase family protein [Sedimentisphaeraceae bacterium JB056]
MTRFVKILISILILISPLFAASKDTSVLAVWSDTHFGAYDYNDKTRIDIIKQINDIASKEPPEELKEILKNSPIETLIHCGDITEKGLSSQWNDPDIADQRSYISTVGHLDTNIKTLAALGNHDSRKEFNIRKQFADFYGATYYSRNINNLHVIFLDPYPNLNSAAPILDKEQLKWLAKDLLAIEKNTPILFIMHVLPCHNEKLDRTSRLDKESSEKLYDIISDYNIIAFFHGHWHKRAITKWNNIDIIAPAGFSYYRKGCPQGEPIIAITTLSNDTLKIYGFNWHKDEFEPNIFFAKKITQNICFK